MRRPFHILLRLLAGFSVIALSAPAPAQELLRREIAASDVKELNATIKLSFGHVSLRRGTTDKIAVIEYTKPKESESDLECRYSAAGGIGSLVIRSEEEEGLWDRGSDKEHREWSIELTDRIPVLLHFELGAGEGDIDLTGLKLRTMNLSAGASSIRLECNELNRIKAEFIEIESGVSKLTAHNLCNINFDRMAFSGGVGSYRLDFGGNFTRNATVTIEVGLGAVAVTMPEGLPARIKHDDSWFSSFDLDGNFLKKSKGVYESAAFGSADQRLVIAIESGLGTVKVHQR